MRDCGFCGAKSRLSLKLVDVWDQNVFYYEEKMRLVCDSQRES